MERLLRDNNVESATWLSGQLQQTTYMASKYRWIAGQSSLKYYQRDESLSVLASRKHRTRRAQRKQNACVEFNASKRRVSVRCIWLLLWRATATAAAATTTIIILRQYLWCYHTIRYDTRCYFNVRSKADISQLNLPHGTDN